MGATVETPSAALFSSRVRSTSGTLAAILGSMLVRVICLLGFTLLASNSPGATAKVEFPDVSRLGRLFVASLTNAPFPHASRSNGHTYQGTAYPAAKHYADSSTAFFIPRDFKPGTEVDVVVHFHGWRNSIAGAARDFDLIGQFAASGRNAVLLLPEGPLDAPDSSGGKLEDPGGFARFMAESMEVLRRRGLVGEARVGRVILSGHSGAYRVISAIVESGGLKEGIGEVLLFDALYGQADRFQTWFDGDAGRRLVVLYADTGGTLEETKKFMAEMVARGTPLLHTEESSVIDDQLRSNRLVFLHSAKGHNEVLSDGGSLRRFLATSGLRALAAGN